LRASAKAYLAALWADVSDIILAFGSGLLSAKKLAVKLYGSENHSSQNGTVSMKAKNIA
jgi:hypothetical protein